MWNGKLKAVTFSFDDGVMQDRKCVELLNKYGIKATFNLNSNRFGKPDILDYKGQVIARDIIPASEAKTLYTGHEIAVHTKNHPHLYELSDEEIVDEIEGDRIALSKLFGYEVIGMAYPYGLLEDKERIVRIIKEKTKIKYARTVDHTYNYDLQTDLIEFKPSGRTFDFETAKKLIIDFVNAETDKPQLLYLWGHTYEFDLFEGCTWEQFEELLALLANKEDVFYGTNKDVLIG